MRYVEVDDHGNVVNVDAACHNVRSHEHVYLTRLEFIENLVTLSLLQVGVHFARVDLHLLQSTVDGLHLLLLS